MFFVRNEDIDSPVMAMGDINSFILIIMLLVTSVMVMPQSPVQDDKGGGLPPPKTGEDLAPNVMPKTPSRVGFTLRFADDTALAELTARGIIKLYSITGSRRLNWQYQQGWIAKIQEKIPQQYYELEQVPEELLQTAIRVGKGKIEFGITLPDLMLTQIRQYISAHTGGDLTIAADGTVMFSP